MKIIEARNVHQALPQALSYLQEVGIERRSRNGLVLVAPHPVVTVYQRPWEKVIFWPERDANPFLHLYESLWMLAGRNDIAPLVRYAKRFQQFSDDGVTQHGAYGHRWRRKTYDQLEIIGRRLRENHDDRRSVLQMWDAFSDLGRDGADVPCNLVATFQVSPTGFLDLTVFCRSNDIIWGAYGANAVHFAMLLEYMALRIGVTPGTYRQVSVNWHAYTERLAAVQPIIGRGYTDPYSAGAVTTSVLDGTVREVDQVVTGILHDADNKPGPWRMYDHHWANTYAAVLEAHELYRNHPAPERYVRALHVLEPFPTEDWAVAARQWLQRRQQKYENDRSSAAWAACAERAMNDRRSELQ